MTPSRRIATSVFALSLALAVVFGPGCSKKSSVTAPTPTPMGTVTGLVQDAAGGTPIATATVKTSAGATATTGSDGRFSISVPANQNVRVDVTRSDYSLNQAVVKLGTNETRAVTVNLMTAGSTASVAPATGGKVTDANSNATLTLPANFVTASGPVTVRVTGLDPTSDQIKALPGGLNAVDANGHAVYLKPVSFAEYTVKDAGGNTLQFNTAASSGAQIELPIPASLRGQPGYQNGDPIECYVYDPADGKWKTPVAGQVGPSSVDGQPAIKATIFHLSWYGGAPASNQIACVEGKVTLNGVAVPNCDVEAFPGGRTTTDAQGHYQVEAAANSNVRVEASIFNGTTFRTAEGSVLVGSANVACSHLDLALGGSVSGQYTIYASLSNYDTPAPGPRRSVATATDIASAQIHVTAGSSQIAVTGALVQVGNGSTWYTLTDVGNGAYLAYTGQQSFALTPGTDYTFRVDYDNDGTFDASGVVKMVGAIAITAPTDGASVGHSFTGTWSDAGSGAPGYSAFYEGSVSGDSTYNYFITHQRTYTVGNGVADPLTNFPNDPLIAGPYSFEIIAGNGPSFVAAQIDSSTAPNITGPSTTGYLVSITSATAINLTSTGVTNRLAAARRTASANVPRTGHRAEALAQIRELDMQVRRKLAQLRLVSHR